METTIPFPPLSQGKVQKKKRARPFLSKRKKLERERQAKQLQEQNTLIHTIKHTELLLSRAYQTFNQTADKDLINASIYEIKALQAQHNFLIRKLRTYQ